jgi:hypothetical protein
LIGSNEKVKLTFCKTQEFTILDAFPTTIVHGYALVARKAVTHWHGQAFVQ